MRTQDIENLKAYRERLQTYSTEELEDIYFRINILRQPLRYNIIRRELEVRRLAPESPPALELRQGCLREWLARQPILVNNPVAFAATLSLLLFLATLGSTLILLLPIWLFAVPFNFQGLEAAIVYIACAPVPPIIAAGIGGKIGGRGLYGISVFAGVVGGLLLFNATGAPSIIVRSALSHVSGGGVSFGGM